MAREIELTFEETEDQGLETLFVRVTIYGQLSYQNGQLSYQRIRLRTQICSVPPSLIQALIRWQKSFHAIVDPSMMEDETEEYFSCNCWQSYEHLITKFNYWLDTDQGWQQIQEEIRYYVPRSEIEIYFLIQSKNATLQQLPWQDWSFLQENYPQTEIALSSSEYQPPKHWSGTIQQNKVKILAVLGADDDLDLEWDETLFHNLKPFSATIKLLKQPSLFELQCHLKEESGWHIFFYGGHSETLEDGTGLLWLNNQEPPIQIEQLEEAFQVAIQRGLQLGIFNSCNGLGLGNYLAHLRFPQLIVMREVIPNKIAIQFLQKFLYKYSRNHSLITSLFEAKQSLKADHHHPDYYPGVHHLPTLYSNPALSLPRWKKFRKQNKISPLEFTLLSALILVSFSLPVSLWIEFKRLDLVLFYAKIYPHIVTFPTIFLWGCIWSLYKAFKQLVSRHLLKTVTLIIIFISIVVVHVEWTAPNMLLFEFNQQAEALVTNIPATTLWELEKLNNSPINKISIESEKNIIIHQSDLEKTLIYLVNKPSQLLTKEKTEVYHQYMKRGLDYPQTWSQVKGWQSSSRLFYGLIVFITSFFLLMLLFLWVQLMKVENINNYIVSSQT
ncbi:MAG: hypothetical protein MK111_21500 [Crocosphaera sp.]|uniref:hypothetical protein n=1 Tax=Crocosphaera sp. TaxID=2729996 RepID=UPI002588146A|nr:hypothetical protein [Crocosphaera sp.]MCH2247169.1 hypothetical protein [Crocosphaera sp.]